MKLYWSPNSPYARKVVVVTKEMQINHSVELIETSPPSYVISATQSLINDGSAWHPNIDQDGSVGRSANDFIARKLCRPPRSAAGKRARHMFDVAQRFGIDMRDPLSPRMQAIKDMCLPNGSRVDGIDPPEVPGPDPFKVVDLDNLTTEDIED